LRVANREPLPSMIMNPNLSSDSSSSLSACSRERSEQHAQHVRHASCAHLRHLSCTLVTRQEQASCWCPHRTLMLVPWHDNEAGMTIKQPRRAKRHCAQQAELSRHSSRDMATNHINTRHSSRDTALKNMSSLPNRATLQDLSVSALSQSSRRQSAILSTALSWCAVHTTRCSRREHMTCCCAVCSCTSQSAFFAFPFRRQAYIRV
jgi:hypothetical protein